MGRRCDRLPRMKAVGLLALLILLTACNAGPRVVIHEEEDTTPAPQAAAVANWDYKTDGNTSWACTHSVDNTAELCFRRVQGHLDSFLHLPSRDGNPFFCSRKHCETKIQIDTAAEQILAGTDDTGGGTRILFLPAPDKLLHDVAHAKEVRVSPPMFGVDQQFVFKVDGLKWQ
jgi:hypothetical protein